MPAILQLATTVAALVAGETILWWAGSRLPLVQLDGAAVSATLAEADPTGVALSVLRLLALAVGAALLGTTALGVVARGTGAVGFVVQVDRWTPPSLRHLLDKALGVGLAASIGLGAIPATAEPGGTSGQDTTTLRRLPDAPASTVLRRLPDAPPTPTAQRAPPPAIASVPGDPPSSSAPILPVVPPTSRPVLSPRSPAPASPVRRQVVVHPGDSFWRLAEHHEAERLGRRPSEAETGAYWHKLVAVNRHRLHVRSDPDLLFPGQILIVP